ncbi:MAG: acetylglutamate kinase [Cyclobacteriaceae bacterium]|nr:acetylglutamate kinase [Cyclobacteriaceae bacterium]
MDKPILRIFKIGGKVVEDERQLLAFLKSFSDIHENKILIHGGGKWVSEMSQRLGIEVTMVEGRRVTDAQTLEVVKMMLAGVANKNVVSKLQACGCNAIGLTGADGNSIKSEKRPIKNGIDYGFVGDVKEIDATIIKQLISLSLVPVFAAMTHDGHGQMLNTNADTIASSVAVGMASGFDVELNYCFELNGVLEDIDDPESVIPDIDPVKYNDLKARGIINSGMIPKIDNAFEALKSGVKAVRIMNSKDMDKLANGALQVGTVIQN